MLPISCAILPTMHTTRCTLTYSNPLNKWMRHYCSLTSLPAYKISATFSSNTISRHNLPHNMPHRLIAACTLLHTRQIISAMLSSNCVVATHNTTYSQCMHINMHYTPSTTQLSLPWSSYALTQGKMAQDVGMVWMYCGVVPTLFGLFTRVPSLHVLVFIQRTYLRL